MTDRFPSVPANASLANPLLSNALLSNASPADALTLEQVVDMCVTLQPAQAAMRADSALCVTPLFTALIIDGQRVDLSLEQGRWGAGYTRVSTQVQRSAKSVLKSTSKKRRQLRRQQLQSQQLQNSGEDAAAMAPAKGTADGYSEEEQLTRQIRHFAARGQAFKIYSDCGLTGEYPVNDNRLIRRLLESKAVRYRKIFERTLLDQTSLLRRTQDEIASMRAYLDKRVADIQAGLTDDDCAPDASSADGKRGRGRPRKKTYFRQALTQLWLDIEAGCVHTVAVSDRSRLCRAADLESEFLVLLSQKNTRLLGLIEDLSTLDVSDPLKKGFAYLIAAVNEYRLEEVAGHGFRGFLQMLEAGRAHGKLPWWLERDAADRAVEVPEYARHARRAVELYLSGLGVAAVTTKLYEEGVQVGGQPLTPQMVRFVLDDEAVSGVHQKFGLAWHILPPLLAPDVVAELRARRRSQRDILLPVFGPRVPHRTWANHLYTGLLRCRCGLLLRFSHPTRVERAKGCTGYYYCPARHKRHKPEDHAYQREDKLSAFLRELLDENPNLITNALHADARTDAGAARRALVEEHLERERAAFAEAERAARLKAEQTALGAGIGEQSASFGLVVAELQRGLLEEARAALATREQEMARLAAQAAQTKQSARALAAAERLQGVLDLETSRLDTHARNQLLKSVFAEMTVYPLARRGARTGDGDIEEEGELEAQGCLLMSLVGVETPLPPVRMRRGRGKSVDMPTVAQWVSDIYALAPVDERVRRIPAVKSFHGAMLRLAGETDADKAVAGETDTSLSHLAATVKTDPKFPRRARGKQAVANYMAGNPLYEGMGGLLEDAWTYYLSVKAAPRILKTRKV